MARFVTKDSVVSVRRPESNPGAVVEGRCPTCAAALERRESDGWCPTCRVGWSYRSTGPGEGEIALTFEVDAFRITSSD